MKQRLRYCTQNHCFVNNANKITNPTDADILYFPDRFSTEWIKDIKYSGIVCDVEYTISNEHCSSLIFIPYMEMGLLNHSEELAQLSIDSDNKLVTEQCFCWSVNRKTLDRYLFIKLINWFGLESHKYTWSGIGRTADCSYLIKEFEKINADWMTDEFRSFVLSPIALSENFISPEFTEIDPTVRCNGTGDILHQWKEVQSKIAPNSSVYLLTESSTNFEKNCTFTEKTGWALTAKNFLVWVGNYGQADQAKRMGIDIFDDVINHNYQWYDTLVERCYYAIADNIKILSDLKFASVQRQRCHSRLVNNQNWYLNGGLKEYTLLQEKKLLEMMLGK
jgi:hypothetical protein